MGVLVPARKRYDSEKREGVVKERLCTTYAIFFLFLRGVQEAHYQISVIASIAQAFFSFVLPKLISHFNISGLCLKPRCQGGFYYMLIRLKVK